MYLVILYAINVWGIQTAIYVLAVLLLAITITELHAYFVIMQLPSTSVRCVAGGLGLEQNVKIVVLLQIKLIA